MDPLFELLASPTTMMDAERELVALGTDAVPRLRTLFDGTSQNEHGVAYRDRGLPLICALEIACKLGPLIKPLEAHLVAELPHYDVAARALGALGELAPASVEALADALQSQKLKMAFEAAVALVMCAEDRSAPAQRAAEISETARDFLDRARKRVGQA